MTDPSSHVYYAHLGHDRDGQRHYTNASPNKWWLDLFGSKDPVVALNIRERLPTDPPSTYWGWLDHKDPGKYLFVWRDPDLFEMNFPYGSKVEEDKGKGRRVNLVVAEIPAIK